ncbi:glyoxylate/hydroxypyruvate reductase A [Tianweitania sp.]|uniref:2-hydroxyacid dehydrogenase n=1 Tax=Tianweitania sp. TaxID=2021634 RepID=UPI00289A8C52|nr:glyoxylate/hydroxypyruvate reductase A [Tianweitania sp.]
MTERTRGKVLLTSKSGVNPLWAELLSEDGREVLMEPDGSEDPSIHYAVAWKQPHGVLGRLPNLKAIFSLGAGVDHVLSDPTLPDVPIVRVVSENLGQHMAEYVTWRVLDHHRRGTYYRQRQAARDWNELTQPTSAETTVGFMGIGELGRTAARAVGALGFKLNGWSRRPADVADMTTYAGADGLPDFLANTDILVVLLPLTDATRGIITYDLLRQLRRDNAIGGAVLINAGRGGLQREADILRALEDGSLGEASLDVFETEPLQEASPLWQHPKVFVTPHAAAPSDPRAITMPMLKQMDAYDRGEPLRDLVDRAAGY